MLCERCKKNEATVIREEVIKGKAVRYCFCPECYNEMFGSLNSAINNDILAGLFGSTPKHRKTVCPVCGMHYSEFERTGLLGCPVCYDVFKDELLPYIERIQGKVEHVGKVGVNDSEQDLTLRLRKLQEKLEKAIREGRNADVQKIYTEMAEVISLMQGKEEQ
ncbi:MAG: hypothetical protein LUI60_06075 [Clostridia bacterium]|nr:hypothetical protein [Clostridia bacterium]